jgi:hypothetical protein
MRTSTTDSHGEASVAAGQWNMTIHRLAWAYILPQKKHPINTVVVDLLHQPEPRQTGPYSAAK